MEQSNREPISQEQQDAGLAKNGMGLQQVRSQIAEQLKRKQRRQAEFSPFFDGRYMTLNQISESHRMEESKTSMNPYDEVMTPFGLLSRENAFRLLQESIETGDMDQSAILFTALGYRSF